MSTPRVITIDFETKGIERRPNYPPEPVGFAMKWPQDRNAKYYGWGHPTKNNTSYPVALKMLKTAWNSGLELLFHNGKFDYDVATTHMECKPLPWQRIHDTMFLLFLDDPHQKNLSLKPSAERILGMKPGERDEVRDWILEHKREIEAKIGHTFKPSEAMAYICEAPGDLVGRYANGDVERTEKLFKVLYPRIVTAKMLPAYDRERELMPILLENERVGIRIDAKRLNADIERYKEEQLRAEAWLGRRLRCKGINFDSDAEVAEALANAKQVTEWALTPTGRRSVSKKNLTPDMFKSPEVASVLGYRNRLVTCIGTFMEPWALMAQFDDHIRTSWNQVRNREGDNGKGARTGRMSSSPNFQNIPTDWNKNDGFIQPAQFLPLPTMRGYVLPDDKTSVWGRRDYNQQELRLLGHFEDDKLLERYKANPKLDIHNFVKAEIYRITGKDFARSKVKIIDFGMIYGYGLKALAEELRSTVEEAKELKAAHRRALPGVQELDRGIKDAAREGEPIRTLGGRLYYVEPPMIIDGHQVTFEYKLLNYLIQGSAADATKQAMINYHKTKQAGRFTVQVHDELNISVPRAQAKEEMKILERAMAAIPVDVPLLSDGKTGKNWAVCK